MFRDKKYRDFKTRLSEEPEPHSRYDLSSYRLPTEKSVRDPFKYLPDLSSYRSPPETSVRDPFKSVQDTDLSSYRSPTEESVCAPSQNVKSSGQRETDDIRLVLLGRTGSGKSAVGNTILAKTEFISKVSGSSVTKQSQLAANLNAGHRFVVIDTPGLFDTELTYGDITKEIIRCIHMSTPGPHAFLLVLRIDRFTQEEVDAFSRLFDLFGENMSSYAIIVFTRLDDLEGENTSIEDFIESSNQHLKHFISKVNGRYIAFNNRGTDEQKKELVANLTETLDEMVIKNGGKHYTNKMYEEAEIELQKKIAEVERIKALEKKREVEQIESKFKNKMSEIEASNEELEIKIKTQMKEYANIQSEKEKTQDKIQNIQLELSHMKQDYHKDLAEAKKMQEIKIQMLQEKEKENKRQIDELKKKQAKNEKMAHGLKKTKTDLVIDIGIFVLKQTADVAFKAFIAPEIGKVLMKSFPEIENLAREFSEPLRKSATKFIQDATRNTKYSENVLEL